MFNFMKKGGAEKEEKEKRKKEKKERKENKKRDRGNMTTEELLRLDEVRRSLKIRGRRKEKEKLPSGITADYTASFLAGLEHNDSHCENSSHAASPSSSASLWVRGSDTLTQSDSSEASLTSLSNPATSASIQQRFLPPLPPRPPKRGILKGPRLSVSSVASGDLANHNGENHSSDSSSVLVRNTLQNEVIAYQNIPQLTSHSKLNFNSRNILVKESSVSDQGPLGISTSKNCLDRVEHRSSHQDSSKTSDDLVPSSIQTGDHSASNLTSPFLTNSTIDTPNKLLTVTSTSPSAESLTDTTTTNSSFATPPFSLSPVGESQGFSGFHNRWNRYSSEGLEDLFGELPLPPLAPAFLLKHRVLTIQRQPPPRGDFGFSLRRAMVTERLGGGQQQTRAVIFAEPGSVGQHNNETGLLPGDRLLEVNGTLVDDKSREEIIDLIKSSGTHVTVKVQPVPELSELTQHCGLDETDVELNGDNVQSGTLHRSGSRLFKNTMAKSEHQLASEQAWQESERLWLVHRAGFTAARKIPGESNTTADPDTVKIHLQLEATGDTLYVDDDDVERANPPQFDHSEDLSQLRYVNESSILHSLRQRYASNLIHTHAGGSMIIINPMAPLAIYSEKVMHMFRGCKSEDMPPHIYSLAQSTYRSMLTSRRDHSILLLGRSGSGKTTNFKHILHYLVLTVGSVNKVLTIEKINSISIVLEAFGNARTIMNSNATRFTQIFSLNYDQAGQIASASIQLLLMERSRVVHRPDGEPTFHIFYWLLAGVEGALRKELYLEHLSNEPNLFTTPLHKHEDKQKAILDFARVCSALSVLGVSNTEVKAIWSVLAAIYHLGIAGSVKADNSNTGRWQFSNPQSAQRAASLLGTTSEELSHCLFGEDNSTPRTSFPTSSPTDRLLDRDLTPLEMLEGMVVGLYGEVFNAIAALINRSISPVVHTVSSLMVVDCPGFQNPASCGHQGGATFQDMCHNYLQERLQLLFHQTNIVAPRDRYAQEHIELKCDDLAENEIYSPNPLVSLLDRTSQNVMIRTSQPDLRDVDRWGLLWLLDEEAVYPGACDEGFIERLFMHYRDRDHQLLLRKAPGTNQFVLHHLQGTNPVMYTATGWLKASRENPMARAAVALLHESTKDDISKLFVSIKGPSISSTLGSSVVGMDGTQSLRRASSIRRTFTTGTAGIKRKSVSLQVKFTVDGLIETLRRTKLKFIHCFLPHHNAGLTDLHNSVLKNNSSSLNADDLLINVPLVRSQLRGAQILDAVRLHKQGFPKFLPLSEFRRRFLLLAPPDGRPTSPILDERKAAEDILRGMELDLTSYRVGMSQVELSNFHSSSSLAQISKGLVRQQIVINKNDEPNVLKYDSTTGTVRSPPLLKSSGMMKTSKIPMWCPTSNTSYSLLTMNLYGKTNFGEQNTQTINKCDKKDWENLFRKYEELEIECDTSQLSKNNNGISLNNKNKSFHLANNKEYIYGDDLEYGEGKELTFYENVNVIKGTNYLQEENNLRHIGFNNKNLSFLEKDINHKAMDESNAKSTFVKHNKISLDCKKYTNTLTKDNQYSSISSDGSHSPETISFKNVYGLPITVNEINISPIKTKYFSGLKFTTPESFQKDLEHPLTSIKKPSNSCIPKMTLSPEVSCITLDGIDKSLMQEANLSMALTGKKYENKLDANTNSPSSQNTPNAALTKDLKISINTHTNAKSIQKTKYNKEICQSQQTFKIPFGELSEVNCPKVISSGFDSSLLMPNSSGFMTSTVYVKLKTNRVKEVELKNKQKDLELKFRNKVVTIASFKMNCDVEKEQKVSSWKYATYTVFGAVRASTGRQLSQTRYRTDLEIFFRSGVLTYLEAQRDEKLTDNVIQLQARCRGYLARLKLNELKVQDVAVRCIQRNVRKFMSVRDWPWWRLLVRVTPLLNVYRIEEQLRLNMEELEQLKVKVEKLEQERTHLKHENDRLEAKLTEMTADLAEEHSTSMLATERLESETSERFRMEKELQDLQLHNKTLQQTTDRVEMELLYMRAADLNGIGSDEDEDGEGDASLYKQRYERAVHELEFTRRRLQQQHEDDLEQLVGLKKQLEKKLADAFEEVEEQRQVVGQWKRKVHKLNADNNDLRLLLEEQNARNVLLEKKQRKFDSESQHLQDELRQEKQMRDRLSREKELALAEKYSVEQSLSSLELELDLKEEKVNTLSQQLEELTFDGKTEAEVAQLKKAKHELEKKVKEQEEELDDFAGQVQLLEQAKLRLEMSLEQQRKENRREMAQRDEELEDVHCNAQKKVKVLEAQLETEHEERTHLLREKHELERRLATMDEEGRAKEALQEEQLLRLRRDLRRNKVLLRDAQTMLERSRGDSPSKAILRQLRNQLEDTDFARTIAVKAKQALEMDLADLQTTLDEVQRAKSEAEEKASLATRERSEIRSQLEENEEELSEVLKKYRAAVQQLSVDQMVLQDQAGMVAELESERSALKEQLAELAIKLESMETVGDPTSSLAQKRLEFRIKELESKLELEQTTRCRMEVQISRMKEALDKLQNECAIQRTKEQTSQDTARKLQRTVRELRDGMSVAEAREAEITQKKRDLEKRLETAEAEATAAKGDLRLALKRIEDLQSAIQGDMEEGSNSEPDNSDSDHESDYSDESLSTFLTNKGRSSTSSLHLDVTAKATERAKHNNASEVVNASANCIPKESFA